MKYTFLLIIIFTSHSFCQEIDKFIKTITQEELKSHLYYLASAELMGRNTGEQGQKEAAEYIGGYFNHFSLDIPLNSKDGYFQRFNLFHRKINQFKISNKNIILDYTTDFMIDNKGGVFEGSADFQLIFIGYGLESDYEGVDARGKVVIYFDGYPPSKKYDKKRLRPGDIIVTDEKSKRAFSNGALGAIKILKDEKTARWFIEGISGSANSKMRLNEPFPSGIDTLIPACMLMPPSSTARLLGIELMDFDQILDVLDQEKKLDRTLETTFHIEGSYINREVSTENVLGYLPGKELREELVIVMAHYDHIGMKGEKICRGANDNASGVAALLEIAEAFSVAASNGKVPKRSILFLAFSAEEKGLLGSEYYVNNPVFPIEKTKLLLNMDMLGRSDFKHSEDASYIYVDLSDSANSYLHNLSLKAESDYKSSLTTVYHFNNKSVATGSSDHLSFSNHKIPFLYYYNGIHTDYNKPSDTPDKIDYNRLADITRFIFATIYKYVFDENI